MCGGDPVRQFRLLRVRPPREPSRPLEDRTLSTTENNRHFRVIGGGITLPAGAIPLPRLARFAMTPMPRLIMGDGDPPTMETTVTVITP